MKNEDMYYLEISQYGVKANYTTQKVTKILETIKLKIEQFDFTFDLGTLINLRYLQMKLKETELNEKLRLTYGNTKVTITKCQRI